MKNLWHIFEKKGSNKRDIPENGREFVVIWSDGTEDGPYVTGFSYLDFDKEIYPVCWMYIHESE